MILKEETSIDRIKSFLNEDDNNYRFEIVGRYANEPLYSNEEFKWYFYRNENDICGIACFVENRICKNSYHISVICINKDFRGKGIGSFIVDDLIVLAKSKGKNKITLHSLKDSKKFYEKLGFKAMKDGVRYFKKV